MRESKTITLIILPTLFFAIEKLFIVHETGLTPLSILTILAVTGGIFRELFIPFAASSIANLTNLTKYFLGKFAITLVFIASILFSLINLVSFVVSSTPFRIEYLNHLDHRAFQQFYSLGNSALLILTLLLLVYFSRLIYFRIGETSKSAEIAIALIGAVFFFLFPSPQSYRYTATWEDALADVKTDIALDYTYKDPISFFVNSFRLKLSKKSFGKFSPQEQAFLKNCGFSLPPGTQKPFFKKPQYKKIVFIVFEALDINYLHFFNPEIPKEASSFFDELLQQYPNMTNFYTSNYPTSCGRYALVFSRIPYLIHFSLIHKHKSIFTLFKEAFPKGITQYLRNSTKYYGGDQKLVIEAFKMDEFICADTLRDKYNVNYTYEWGVHNDVIFKELASILEKNASTPCMIFSKTIDGHFPYHFGENHKKEIPETVKNHPSRIVKTVFWNNSLLENFFSEIKKKGLFRDDTLFIITTDHTPNPNFGHKELVKNKKFQQLDKIPLIFVSSNLEPLKTLRPNLLCSQVDLPTTVCSILGITPPKYYLGRNLLATSTLPLSMSHFADYFFIKTATRSYAIPENENVRDLTWEEKTILKYFDQQKTVEFNEVTN